MKKVLAIATLGMFLLASCKKENIQKQTPQMIQNLDENKTVDKINLSKETMTYGLFLQIMLQLLQKKKLQNILLLEKNIMKVLIT
jgi:hypothetical protein